MLSEEGTEEKKPKRPQSILDLSDVDEDVDVNTSLKLTNELEEVNLETIHTAGGKTQEKKTIEKPLQNEEDIQQSETLQQEIDKLRTSKLETLLDSPDLESSEINLLAHQQSQKIQLLIIKITQIVMF